MLVLVSAEADAVQLTFTVPSVTAVFDGVPQPTGSMTIVATLDSTTVPITFSGLHLFQLHSATVTAPSLGLSNTAITSLAPIYLEVQDPPVFGIVYLTSNPGGGNYLWDLGLDRGDALPATDLGDLQTYSFPFSIQKDGYRLRTNLNGGAPITFENGSAFDIGQHVTDFDGLGLGTINGVTADCGNSLTEPAEQCDDGGTVAGDCCSPICLFEPDGSGCDDGEECSLNDACSTGSCLGMATPDPDGDGLCSAIDNCPDTGNPLQENSDALPAGDACQCGNLDATGGVTPADLLALRGWLVGRTPTGGPPDVDFCDVNADGDCSVADAFVLDRFLSGQSATVESTCAAFVAP
jgi:cysteine-rich repeat protein